MGGPTREHGAPGDHDAHKHAHKQESDLDPLEVRNVLRQYYIYAFERCHRRTSCDENHPKHPQVVARSRDRPEATRVGQIIVGAGCGNHVNGTSEVVVDVVVHVGFVGLEPCHIRLHVDSTCARFVVLEDQTRQNLTENVELGFGPHRPYQHDVLWQAVSFFGGCDAISV